MLAPFPRNPLVHLMLATGQSMMVGKLGFTVGSLLAPNDRGLERLFPFIRPHLRARVRRESAVTLGVLGAGVTFGLLFVPGFAWALLAWPFAHLFLGLYVMAEHTGIPHEGTQLERTRPRPRMASSASSCGT